MFAAKNTAAPSGEAVYIESVFSTYLYTGTGSSQTITNSIDLSTKGGLVWIKGRSGATGHRLTDTVRGATKSLESNSTAAEATESTGLTAFGTTGFTIGADADYNTNAATYASWTFRKQAKFFDVVTYTGNGSNRTISHSLGSVPGCIIVKRTDTTGNWQVYHRSVGNTKYLVLNTNDGEATSSTRWNNTTPTSTEFSLGTEATVNASGGTYVAYLFAHDAGGFGASGSDNVISCGSYTDPTGTSMPTVNLGWEPQFLIIKGVAGGSWWMFDSMRGMPATNGAASTLVADSSGSEITGWTQQINATGFTHPASIYGAGTFIYIAIRRPMKTPTSGTSVFSPVARTGTSAAAQITGLGFAPDFAAIKARSTNSNNTWLDKVRGAVRLQSDTVNAEDAYTSGITSWNNDGISLGAAGHVNGSPETFINYIFRRAPGFFDVVCYTGTGTEPTNVAHSLTVPPQLMIIKRRSSGGTNWTVFCDSLGANFTLQLNSNIAKDSTGIFPTTQQTASYFILSTSIQVNASAETYVAYLFATVAGVSKVGSYTGTGTTQTINCGFTAGARFVMIKRTDSTGDWYVWDTARGIVSGNDPYLLINSTAAEVTNTDYIDPANSGFEISSTAPAAINANGGTFIFLAIA
jgi:hypothetical protein